MTLNTRVAIKGRITPNEAIELAVDAICDAVGNPDLAATAVVLQSDRTLDPRVRRILAGGPGIPANVDCLYRPDSPLHLEDEYCDPRCYPYDATRLENPACSVIIGWDTDGYWDVRRAMHADAVRHVHSRLARDAVMHWHNEYTGEWHTGADNLDTLIHA